MIQIKKITILLAILFIISCSLTTISANNDINDNIAINEEINHDNLEKVSTATNFTTLQQEINENDEITLNNNVTMLNEEQENFADGMIINKTIAIDGNGYTIDANGLGRIFNITDTGSLTLKNTNLINGKNNEGGVIYNNGNNSVIINCKFNNNTAKYGGVIYNNGNNSVIINCKFNNNTAKYGGAILNYGYNCTAINCSFINNIARYGGGAIINYCDCCSVINCSFINNVACYYGGAIINYCDCCSIVNCNFINNTASNHGGAMYNWGDCCSVVNCSFSGNNASSGGAIYNDNRVNFSVVNCSFINNTVSNHGGAMYNLGDCCSVINCSFINNIAIDYGRAMYNSGDCCTVINCNFINNIGGTWGDGAISIYGDCCSVINCSFINNTASYYGDGGGSIHIYSGYCIVTNCSFINNTAIYGGAISNEGNCTVTNCSFINNNVCDWGGAISNEGNCTINNCGFINNTAGVYGGDDIINNLHSICILNNTTFNGSNNMALSNHGNCTLTNCNFINKVGNDYGGAIYNCCYCIVTNCSFINNTARYGGAILNCGDTIYGEYCIVTNCSFINNTARYGGAICNYGNCTIYDCDFDNSLSNTSEIYLSEKFSENSYLFLRNNTFNIKENTFCIELGEGYITSPTIATVMDNETGNVTLFYRYNVKVVFRDDNGNIIGIHNNASVLINESKYDLINNGTYSYNNFKSREVGTFSVGVVSDFLTNLSVKNGTLEVLPNPIELILQNLTKYYNTTDKLIATLTNNKTGMVNETITFIINGKEYNSTTDSNGIACLNINLNSGVYAVKAFYNDSDVYLFDATVTILTTINANDLVKFYRNVSQFYVTFLNLNGTALAGTNVTFNINGVWYTRTTNNNGIARLNINLDSGKYVLTAVNPLNKENKGFNITILSTINSSDIVKYFRNGTQYSANFTAFNGSALANVNVKFNINGVFYTKTTNENGTATLNINLQPGRYVLTAINPLTNETIGNNVTVRSVLVGEDLNKTKAENKSYEVTVLDGQGNTLANQTVQMNIHGVIYNKTTDENGIARLAIRLDAGDYIITTTWNGTFTSNKISISSVENNTTEENNTEKQEFIYPPGGVIIHDPTPIPIYVYPSDVLYPVFVCNECGGFFANSTSNLNLGFNQGHSDKLNACIHHNCSLNLDLWNTPILDFYHGWFVSDDAYNSFIYKANNSLKDNSNNLENKTLNDINWGKWYLLEHFMDNSSIANDSSLKIES